MMTQTMTPAPIAPSAAPKLAPSARAKPRGVAPVTVLPVRSEPASPAAASPEGDARVELVQLSEVTWRVCDSHATPGERGYIVGYLEQLDDELEMLWMHPRPGVVYRHADFDEAVRAISMRLRMSAR